MSEAPPNIPGLVFVKVIGSGGYSDVYLYQQQLPRRPVAVKVLHGTGMAETLAAQLTAEANVMAGLADHPNIVPVFAAGLAEDRRPYIAMMYYPRQNLGARAASERLGIAEVLRIGIQIASAIETAHRAGILHRDIKPANILTSQYGVPGLTDFGIAGQLAAGEDDDQAGVSVPWSAPEVLYATAPATVRSDVYSLAATLWHLLAGHSPFEVRGGENTAFALMRRVRDLPVPATGRPDAPEQLERLLRQAMAKDPAARPASALDFARALQAVESSVHLQRTEVVVLSEPHLDTGTRPILPAPLADPTRQRGPQVISGQGPAPPVGPASVPPVGLAPGPPPGLPGPHTPSPGPPSPGPQAPGPPVGPSLGPVPVDPAIAAGWAPQVPHPYPESQQPQQYEDSAQRPAGPVPSAPGAAMPSGRGSAPLTVGSAQPDMFRPDGPQPPAQSPPAQSPPARPPITELPTGPSPVVPLGHHRSQPSDAALALTAPPHDGPAASAKAQAQAEAGAAAGTQPRAPDHTGTRSDAGRVPRSPRRTIVIIVAAVIVIAGLAVGIALSVGDGGGHRSAGPTLSQSPVDQNPNVGEPGPPGDPTITAKRSVNGVTFAWTYQNPLADDYYYVRTDEGHGYGSRQLVHTRSYTVSAKKDVRVCIELEIDRADGSNPALSWSAPLCTS